MNKKLKELRDKRGLSQAEVADFIGISRQMYNKYENGEVEPSLKAIKALCTLYAISFNELLNEDMLNEEYFKQELQCADSGDLTKETESSQEKSSVTYKIESTKDLSVDSPTPAYSVSGNSQNQMYGTTNVLSQILELLPKLLFSEKAKLLTSVAQSMSNDVEAGQLARKSQPQHLNHGEPKRPTHEEFEHYFEENKKLMKSTNFNTHGVKWTREEMHER